MTNSVFAYIDIEHPVVAWGAYRGVLVSANAEYVAPNCPISMMFSGIAQTQNNIRLRNELIVEAFRQTHYPHSISRLSGMYFFETEHQARLAQSWGGHFSSNYLAELELFPSQPVSRHDSNWITYARVDDSERITEEKGEWLSMYWSGEPFPGKEPIWEVIAHGRAVIWGTELRERAYKVTKERFPEALSVLEISRIAAYLGSDLGQSCAWLIRGEDGSLRLSYYLDMRDATNPDFLKRLKEYRGPKNISDLSVGGDHFRVPDFTEYSCTFSVERGFSHDFLYSVHRNQNNA